MTLHPLPTTSLGPAMAAFRVGTCRLKPRRLQVQHPALDNVLTHYWPASSIVYAPSPVALLPFAGLVQPALCGVHDHHKNNTASQPEAPNLDLTEALASTLHLFCLVRGPLLCLLLLVWRQLDPIVNAWVVAALRSSRHCLHCFHAVKSPARRQHQSFTFDFGTPECTMSRRALT